MNQRPSWTISANKAIRLALKSFACLPPTRLSVWADDNFYLSAESSQTQGKWKAYPYQIGILDAFANKNIEIIDVKKAARTGYTKMLLAATSYFTIVEKRNQAIWHPTDSKAEKFTQVEYNTMLTDVKAIKPVFPMLGKKHAHNKNNYKKFLSCITYILGGTSENNFKSITVSVGILDEYAGFDADIGNEGSAGKLAWKRLEGATFPKLIRGSVPKEKYTCLITKGIEDAEAVYRYHVPCPHCNIRQALEFGGKGIAYGLKWIGSDYNTAQYLCKHCNALFTQADYLSIWQHGRWEDQTGNWIDDSCGEFKNPAGDIILPQKHIGIDGLWTAYSPQVEWSQIVKEFLEAQKKAKVGDKSELKTFINQTLGQTYEDDVEKTDATELKNRAEDFPLGIVPLGGLILYASVDIQKDRFEIFVWAFGEGEEMWSVDYIIITANPTIHSEFSKLDAIFLKTYPHAAGTVLPIENVAIDTGNWTQQAYSYIRLRVQRQHWENIKPRQRPPKLYATKGASTHGKPISNKPTLQDITESDRVLKRGVKLYMVGTEQAKDLFHNRLQLTQHGSGFIHLSKHLPDQVFDHFCAEVRAIVQTKKGDVHTWVVKRSGIRNECLDLVVMCLFLAHKTGLHNKTKREWDFLTSIVQPNQNDLFSTPSSSTDSSTKTVMPTHTQLIQEVYIPS